jgi:hypothetical protein
MPTEIIILVSSDSISLGSKPAILKQRALLQVLLPLSNASAVFFVTSVFTRLDLRVEMCSKSVDFGTRI